MKFCSGRDIFIAWNEKVYVLEGTHVCTEWERFVFLMEEIYIQDWRIYVLEGRDVVSRVVRF